MTSGKLDLSEIPNRSYRTIQSTGIVPGRTFGSVPMPNEGGVQDFTPTQKTRVKRLHERGHYDRETVYAILDAGFICHVGYVIDDQPYVTPTSYWREGDSVYWHGSSASRMLRTISKGIKVCLTVTHVDGLVLARSGFHSSINYRAVM